jgi:hypothetical protein
MGLSSQLVPEVEGPAEHVGIVIGFALAERRQDLDRLINDGLGLVVLAVWPVPAVEDPDGAVWERIESADE